MLLALCYHILKSTLDMFPEDEWAFNSTDTREQRKTFCKKEAHKIICISASFPSSLSQNTVDGCVFASSSCLFTAEGNGNPLQCSCLESPRDGGAWWAAICGVTQSRTRLK